MSPSQPSASAPEKRSATDRLRERLKLTRATDDAIDFALEESRRQQQIRNRALKGKLKALTAQINELTAQASGSPVSGGESGSGRDAIIGGGVDRLLDVRDQIADAKAALTLATERMGVQTDGHALSDLTAGLSAMQGLTRQLVWILGIGMAFTVPAVLALLVLTIWDVVAR